MRTVKLTLTIICSAAFFVESMGVSYALRPMASGNLPTKFKAALVSYGKLSKAEPTSQQVSDLLKWTSPLSEQTPTVKEIRRSINKPGFKLLRPEKMLIESTIVSILYENFGQEFYGAFHDPKKDDLIPIKKVLEGKMGGLAMIIETEGGERTILLDEGIFNMRYGVYLSLVGAGAYNQEKAFTYKAHLFSVFHQLLAYLSLDENGRVALGKEVTTLKDKAKASLDEFIDFANKVTEKIIGEDCSFLYSDEFIESIFSFVEEYYPDAKTKAKPSKKAMAKRLNRLAKEYRIGRWILRNIIRNAVRFGRPEFTPDEKEKVFRQVNKLVKLEWLTKSDLFTVLMDWGIYGGLGQEVVYYLVKNNPDYFDSKCIETLAMSMAASDDMFQRFRSGINVMKEFISGIPKDTYMPAQEDEVDLETREILDAEKTHYVAAGMLETVAEIYPQKITQKAFKWMIISLEIFLRGCDSSWPRDDNYYYDSSSILKALKDRRPDIYAKFLVGSDIGDNELVFLISGYRRLEKEDLIEDKYINLDTVAEIAKLALSSKDKEAAIILLRRIINLKPVFMLRLFDRIGSKIYELFDELKGIPLENFQNLEKNKRRWGLNNDFVALSAGDKPVDKDILQLDVLFEEESPFVCIKLTKGLFSSDSSWTINEVEQLYAIYLFQATWNFHPVYIDRILALNAKERRKVFMVLRESVKEEELYWLSKLLIGYIVTAILEHADDMMDIEDAVLEERLSKVRELIREKKDLEPSLYMRLILAEDNRTFTRLYSGVLLSIGVKVELEVSAELKNRIMKFKRDFEDAEPMLSEKETAGDIFYYILQLFDLCDVDTLATLTTAQIKRKYRKLAMVYHPDKSDQDRTFKMVGAAYQLLNDFVDENGKADFEQLTKEPPRLEPDLSENITSQKNHLTAMAQAA